MRNIFTNTVLAGVSLALTAGIVAASASPAAASTNLEVRHLEVRFADLDLSTLSGRKDLDARIRTAAINVCPAEFNAGAVDPEALQCRANAIRHAHRDIADRLAMRSASTAQNGAS